jgi:hypothetical protein
MDTYTPIIAIVMYIASLLAPEGTNELTFAGDGQVITFIEQENTWSRKDGSLGTITFENGYVIERHESSKEQEMKELLSDHMALPVDLEKGEIDLKRAPYKIEFEKKDELVIFTVTRKGQPSSDIRISWTD